jgi:hypothetical protein
MNYQILITDFLGGFAPKFYAEGYPSYGNKNHAGAMLNCDLTNASGFQQGPGLSTLTAGTQAGAVTTLLRSILDQAVTSDTTYGIGGAKLQQITSDEVINTGIWPHTIDKATVTGEDGEDVAYYQGVLYYTYNHSGTKGDIGKYDLATTFDDDWGSTVPTGKAELEGGVPHQMVVGGTVLWIANGKYIASWDGTTFNPQALDLPANTVVKSITWMADKLWITANRPDTGGTNKNNASVFIWDGTTDDFETEIKVMGSVGGLHVKNGILYFFYQDVTNLGGFKLAYLNGTTVVDLANFSGGLPTYYQITDYKDFILWNSTNINTLWSIGTYPWQLVSPWTTTTGDDLLYAYGTGDKDLPARFFQLADSGYTTAGAVSAPFGTPMIASTESTNFKLAQFAGYDVNSNWKSLNFDITSEGRTPNISTIRINFAQLALGARVDWKLVDNTGKILYSDTISYAKNGAVTSVFYPMGGIITTNFRIEFDYTNGSTSNTVKIKAVKVYGTS